MPVDIHACCCVSSEPSINAKTIARRCHGQGVQVQERPAQNCWAPCPADLPLRLHSTPIKRATLSGLCKCQNACKSDQLVCKRDRMTRHAAMLSGAPQSRKR